MFGSLHSNRTLGHFGRFVFAVAVLGMLIELPVLAQTDDSQTASAPPPVDYLKVIRPILESRCFACHGALKQEAELRLDTVANMLRGGESGQVIELRRPSDSLLLTRIRDTDPSTRMPPEAAPLTHEQIGLIERWIQAGAIAPADEPTQADPRTHWAFLIPVKSVPASEQNPSSNPIDVYFDRLYSTTSITPLPSTDKRTLIRRLYLDVLGIPPTPDEIHEYERDDSNEATDKLIDGLLGRPEYGERWGRHWMDVWRYSDWYGRRSVPDVMNSYPQIWRWRDWIVRSLNEDKGYDRMVEEMLAADELCPGDEENGVATGFLVRNWFKWNYETWMKDNVEHTSKAFLGLTMNCAHCHDHKYDPISNEDYFRFRAFFEPLELRHVRFPGSADPGMFQKYVYTQSYGPITGGGVRVFDEKLDAQTFMYKAGDNRNRIEGKPATEPSPPFFLRGNQFTVEPVELPQEVAYPGLQPFVRTEEIETAAREVAEAESALEKTRSEAEQILVNPTDAKDTAPNTAWTSEQQSFVHKIRIDVAQASRDTAIARLDSLTKRIAADDQFAKGNATSNAAAQAAAFSERKLSFLKSRHTVLAAQLEITLAERELETLQTQPESQLDKAKQKLESLRKSLSAARDAEDQNRAQLSKASSEYTPLSPKYPSRSTGRRLALAKWITNRSNPLTARVAVNHIWLRHFGQAFVDTTDNLGVQGKPPRHRELLDQLAVELMDHNWSMKHIHRLILKSSTYQRQSNPGSTAHPNFAVDRDNQSYWRFPVRRMEAEVVRDSILESSGRLDKTRGGQELDPAQWATILRRSLYFSSHGEGKMQFIETFDGPSVSECYRRVSTIMPQHALAMTNSQLLNECGQTLSQKISEEVVSMTDTTQADRAFIDRAFEHLLGRLPSVQETAVSIRALDALTDAAREGIEVNENSSANTKDSESNPTEKAKRRARANFVTSLYSHNDFIAIR